MMKEILYALSLMGALFGFGTHVDESIFDSSSELTSVKAPRLKPTQSAKIEA